MAEIITSANNPRIREVARLLKKPHERRKEDLVVIEGVKECLIALKSGIIQERLFLCTEKLGQEKGIDEILKLFKGEVVEVSTTAFEKMAYREGTGGVIILARPVHRDLNDLSLSQNPLIIILESVEKPGNLGAVLRTADAANADAVIVCDPATDIFNPNVIRSSLGCVFSRQVVSCSSQETADWCRKRKISTFAAALSGTKFYHEADYKIPLAFVMGSEAEGLTDFWLQQSDCQIKIPMSGIIDSLNVSVSTAILIFEAVRQRGFFTA